MKRWFYWGSLAVVVLLLASTTASWAAFDKEILQAVNSGRTNNGSDRVVVAELTAGDW
jgi:hypothetical protein